MARPTESNPEGEQISPKLTEGTLLKLEQAFAIDATVNEACAYADISKTTYYRWLEEHPELSDRFERLRQKPMLAARNTMVKALQSDADFALKYAERKMKKEFSTKQEIEQTGKLDITVKFEDLSDEELEKIIAE